MGVDRANNVGVERRDGWAGAGSGCGHGMEGVLSLAGFLSAHHLIG